MSEQLAVIHRSPEFGVRDRDKPMMWFTVWIDEGSAADIYVDWEYAGKALIDAEIYSTENLCGRCCWVEIKDGIVKFKRFWKTPTI